MLYKIPETEKIFQIPVFPGSQRNIPEDAIPLCEESCITSKCPHHQKNPGGCRKEKELQINFSGMK